MTAETLAILKQQVSHHELHVPLRLASLTFCCLLPAPPTISRANLSFLTPMALEKTIPMKPKQSLRKIQMM